MIEQAIWLLVVVMLFVGAACLSYWLVKKFELPQFVLWIVGVLLLICLLLFVSHEVGGESTPFVLHRH